MSQLTDYLRYLERDDVSELLFQSDRVIAARVNTKLRPLTKEQLDTRSIVELLAGAGLGSYFPAKDTRGTREVVQIGTKRYDLVVARQGDMLQARFARVGSWTAAAPAPAPAPVRSAPTVTEAAPSPVSIQMPPSQSHGPESAPGPLPSHPPRASHPGAQTYSVAPTKPTDTVPPELEALLLQAREANASDVHISAENEARFRIVGQLKPQGPVLSAQQVDAMLRPTLSEPQQVALDEKGYADFALELQGIGRLRVNLNKQRTGLKACFRLIAARPFSMQELGLPTELRKIVNYHQGLAIVSGPNGHGKTTTMAALVDLINEERSHHVITVEDPVEYLHTIKKSVLTQRQVGLHTNSFYTALKAALREDPDVIIIGELRDRETVAMALSAAETGHLVIATMSTPSAAKTIDRLIDLFPPEDQAQVRATLAGALKLVISQRLIPSHDGQKLYAASELITGGIPLWTLIRDNKLFQLPSLQQRGRNFGMIRLEDSLNELLAKGLISVETAKHFAPDPRLIGPKQDPTGGSPAAAPPPVTKKKGFFS